MKWPVGVSGWLASVAIALLGMGFLFVPGGLFAELLDVQLGPGFLRAAQWSVLVAALAMSSASAKVRNWLWVCGLLLIAYIFRPIHPAKMQHHEWASGMFLTAFAFSCWLIFGRKDNG